MYLSWGFLFENLLIGFSLGASALDGSTVVVAAHHPVCCNSMAPKEQFLFLGFEYNYYLSC